VTTSRKHQLSTASPDCRQEKNRTPVIRLHYLTHAKRCTHTPASAVVDLEQYSPTIQLPQFDDADHMGKVDLVAASFDSFDKNFAFLLRSPASEYMISNYDHASEIRILKLWKNRVGLPILQDRIKPVLQDTSAFFGSRAALILEEAREVLTSVLLKSSIVGLKKDTSAIHVSLKTVDNNFVSHRTRVAFQRSSYPRKLFSPTEKKNLQQGTIFSMYLRTELR
jgi:hypothetical protein